MDGEEQLVNRLLKLLEPMMATHHGESRIVVLCRTGLAVRLAERLRNGLIIVLQSEPGRPPAPKNIEFLTCDLAGAQFLPESVSAVLAFEQDERSWQDRWALPTIADWLQPGGIFCLNGRPNGLRRWWPSRFPGPGRDLLAMAQSVGLRREEDSMPQFRTWRKVKRPSPALEEQHGPLDR